MQGPPVTRYPDTMLVQCCKSVIDDDTTFNQHWVSASQKEAVTLAERKYILDLQVSKYGLLAALKAVNAQYTRKQIMPSDIAQTKQIVAEVNDRRLPGMSTLNFVDRVHKLKRCVKHPP